MIESGVRICGYAIVSANDCIADAQGNMPASLQNEADWRRFQAELDRASLVVLGRLGHEAHPNPRGRRRLVVSRSANGFEQRGSIWWWSPQLVGWADVARALLPAGGRVAVPGGRGVFDLFLVTGFDEFHLTRAARVLLPGGQAVFSRCASGVPVEDVLREAGLRPGAPEIVDAANDVTACIWTRRHP